MFSFGPPVVEFLANLLSLNPYARLTAHMALEHRIFKTSPLPCEPHEIPQLPSSHEIDGKRTRAIAAAPRGAGVENHESIRYNGDMPASKRPRTNAPNRAPPENSRNTYIPNYGSPNSSLPSSIPPSGRNSARNAANPSTVNVNSGAASDVQRSITQPNNYSETVSRPRLLVNDGIPQSTPPQSSQSTGFQAEGSTREQNFDAEHPPTGPRSMKHNKSNHPMTTNHHEPHPREFDASEGNSIKTNPNVHPDKEPTDKSDFSSLASRELTYDLPSQQNTDSNSLVPRGSSDFRNSVSPDENGTGYSFKVRLGDYFIDRWVPGTPGK